ncbi:MAG: molybdopterin-dependent oxidoreductase, partial [Deltaproteobacteria bacterium]|nr:molybdopterin-dependent oxidoreductase [Deltaproteobacteria bacterium]
MSDYSLIGQRLPRLDSWSKVTGEAIYTADLTLPRMLVCKVLRSPHPHAKILNIDLSRARQVKGVIDIVTGQDTAGVKWGVFRYTRDQELLPTEKVRYVGDEVAAVAAEDEDAALEALDKIDVDYQVLEAVFDPLEAIKDGAPLIHEDYPNNINIHVPIEVGQVEEGFKQSHLVREDTFTSEEESYFMAEPLAVVANCDSAGNVEAWFPNAAPHQKAKALSNALGLPLNKVHIRKIAQGGAFGGRSDVFPGEFITALLARRNRRPVKLVYTREENTIATRQGHSMVVTIKTGVNRQGLVLARDVTAYMDGG